MYRKYFEGWAKRRLSSITKADVLAWHSQIGRDHGPYQANRAHELLTAMFNRADGLGYDGPNPAQGVQKFKEKSRERFLQPQEMRAFFTALVAEAERVNLFETPACRN